ncbi:MAG: hypothetical protein IJZ61_07245 [Oscillospiraceae bacterium]|nr:hypothetical protein [Oscillospiraceae bacterium]
MKKSKIPVILSVAVISAMVMSGCRNGQKPDWEDTLPMTVLETTVPTVVCETEETTTTTPEPTIVTTEKTKRTASSAATEELATTTGQTTTEPTQSTVPTDIENVPLDKHTSSTAYDPSMELKPTTNPDGEMPSDTTASVTSTAETESSTEETLASAIDGIVYSTDEIQRPYSYNQLNEKQQYIYDAVITAAERLKTDVPLSKVMDISADDYCEVYQQIYNDEHALFYIDTKMQYAMNNATKKLASAIIFYKYSDEKILEMQKEIEAEAKKILDGITPDMTEYDIVKHFHDSIASTVVYDETADNCRDIYGVFVDKKAICGGYSKAFSYLCDKVGIETATVTGDADGEAHMWNMVKIDGQWYNIDVTYAVTESEVGSYIRYDYFCVTDEMLADSRTVYEQIYTYPEAVSEECSYYVKNGLIADNWADARAMLINQIGEVSKTDDFVIQIKCSSKEAYDDVVYRLFDASQKEAIKIFEEALPTAEKKYDCRSVNYSQDKNSRVVKLFLKYTE